MLLRILLFKRECWTNSVRAGRARDILTMIVGVGPLLPLIVTHKSVIPVGIRNALLWGTSGHPACCTLRLGIIK
jgi:hypothetical protein